MARNKRKDKKLSEMNIEEVKSLCKKTLDFIYRNTTDVKTAFLINRLDERIGIEVE